jgi:hypothetical protein
MHRRPPDRPEVSTDRLARLWGRLAAGDAARAQQAVAELIESPASTLSFVGKSLHAVAPAPAEHLATLIADLDHEEYDHREKASRDLKTLGELAEPALRRVLEARPSAEVKRRLADLLDALDGKAPSPELLRSLRALQVVEGIGTPEARRVLGGLAGGAPEARLTQEAKASLERLDRRAAHHP